MDLFLLGASGHGKVVADVARRSGRFRVRGFFDDDARKAGTSVGGILVIGPMNGNEGCPRPGAVVLVSIGTNSVRNERARILAEQGWRLATAVHPGAVVAEGVPIGEGTVVMAGVVVNPGCVLGRNVIVNTGATVDHDCVLEDGVHVSPGAHLAGDVRIGRESHVGTGASVIPGIRIGAGSIVGAGAVVIRDVPPGRTAVGNPARILRRKKV